MAINSYPDNSGGEVNFPDQLIDPVSKFRVSNPENLIDTDFEYGLQPTKWETVELINNTPSFFSKSGDTTIDGISSIITNAGTREIIVKTELDHGLAVGIPINVTGTKSITADGAYIINSIPDPKTFTYLCKDNQTDTNSILDLYSSIITGEFFQGSQLRISDSDGIVTDAEGTSILTVTTNTTHGFGENTPFYFLNLNSTVAQEFQAANTASKSFDASNSATAQTFDGSNSLSSVSIDWSNSATFGGTVSTITGSSTANDTITVSHTASENFDDLPLGAPLYYSVSAIGGYFNTNPRGVVFLKTIDGLGTSTSTFQVSAVPDGDVIDIVSTLSGTFQIANQARTFAGNNINPLTQAVINVEVGPAFNFDAGNQGYTGAVQVTPPDNTLTVLSYSGTTINADGASAADYYVGAMVKYSTSGTEASGLVDETTYFVTSVVNNGGGNYDFSVASLPGGSSISITTGSGSGTQTFSRIGLSIDKDIVHIPNSNFSEGDMLEYTFPVDGRFGVETVEEEKRFYFVETVYDSHNYKLGEEVGFRPIEATGGTLLPEIFDQGRTWKVHQFTTTGTSNFVVTDAGKEGILEYLVVAGGGGGGTRHAGGGGGGGVISGSTVVTPQSYTITVGAGGVNPGSPGGSTTNYNGVAGANSSAFGVTALGGGYGSTYGQAGGAGGSGGGAGERTTNLTIAAGGAGTAGQGFDGGRNNSSGDYLGSGGGGGAGGAGQNAQVRANASGGNGGPGKFSGITGTSVAYGGGGGGSTYGNSSSLDATFKNQGIGGTGGGGAAGTFDGVPGTANTGGGGGGGSSDGTLANGRGGNGGSGIVIVRYPITPPIEDFVPAAAIGGTLSQTLENEIIYNVHTFTDVGSSTFTVTEPGSWNQFETLIVGGGGAGGFNGGGGGGGGAVILAKTSAAVQSYTVTVGSGGARRNSNDAYDNQSSYGENGGSSSVFGITATGGGAGGFYNSQPGRSNGANGGGAGSTPAGGSGTGGSAIAPTLPAGIFGRVFAGNSGGNSNRISPSVSAERGGGGAGAGGNGTNTTAGPGVASNIDGTLYFYGGGGGGGAWSTVAGDGGAGGGGGGGSQNQAGGRGSTLGRNPGSNGAQGQDRSDSGGNAGANTGGGGGGATFYATNGVRAGNGGSGIVIIRYAVGRISSENSIVATGGAISTVVENNTVYAIHRFTSTGTTNFNVQSLSTDPAKNQADVLIVAGGGSGGVDNGGGAGGGGVIDRSVTISAAGSYPIVVGAGGAARLGSQDDGPGNGGQNSTAFGFTALGGAGGTGWVNGGVPTSVNGTGIRGGSGSGQSSSNGGSNPQGRGLATQPSSASGGFGNNGGTSVAAYAGGGGGAGGVGENGVSGRAGSGGVGYLLNGKYGSGVGTNDRVGAGGTGGWDVASGFSSNGQISNNGVPKVGNVEAGEQPAPANTGNGGHGANHNDETSGAGGSGIVIVRYPIGSVQ